MMGPYSKKNATFISKKKTSLGKNVCTVCILYH